MIQRIRLEIEELGTPLGPQKVTYENYKQYVWTQAVIFEALRLHPSVPTVRHLSTSSKSYNADQVKESPSLTHHPLPEIRI